MFECWNGGLDGLGGLEGLDWKQLGQLVKTTFKRCASNTPAFFVVDIIRRRARASSPVRQRNVVSEKLFLKVGEGLTFRASLSASLGAARRLTRGGGK